MISFIAPTIRRLESISADLAVLYCFEEMRPFRGITSLVDWRLHGRLSKVQIEGFFKGERDVPLLVPLGRRLPQQYLLILGLGPREEFHEQIYKNALNKTFQIQEDLHTKKAAVALPGRVEETVDAVSAMEWFIEVYERHLESVEEVFLLEQPAAQKLMTPVLERWRLCRLIPGFRTV